MPPQTSPKSVQRRAKFLKAFNKLCTDICSRKPASDKSKISRETQRSRVGSVGVKVDSDTLNSLKEILRDHRNSGKTLEDAFSSRVVKCFDSIRDDICERLEPEIFLIFLEILLQADYSHDSERGLYLLGSSLYNNNKNSKTKRSNFARKKTDYARLSLQWLLSEFVDAQRPFGLRRCIGALCTQLISGSEEHDSDFGDCLEVKIKLGLLITQETDELLRVVAGQIIKVMLENKAKIEEFWLPGASDVHTSKVPQFPHASQAEVGWSQRFQKYLDDMWPKLKHRPTLNGSICFAHKVKTTPPFGFEDHDHTVYILIGEGMFRMTILSSTDSFDQWLETPVDCIREMRIIRREESQINESGDVFLTLDSSKRDSCYVNSKSVKLDQVHIAAFLHTISGLKDDLQSLSKDIEVIGSEFLPPSPQGQGSEPSTFSQVSESNVVVAWNERGPEVISKAPRDGAHQETSKRPVSEEDALKSCSARASLLESDAIGREQHLSTDTTDDELNASDPTVSARKTELLPSKLSPVVRKSAMSKKNLPSKRVRPVAKKSLQLGQAQVVGSMEKPLSHHDTAAPATGYASGNEAGSATKLLNPKLERKIREPSAQKTVKGRPSYFSSEEPMSPNDGDLYDIVASPAPKEKAKLKPARIVGKKKPAPKPRIAPATKAKIQTQSQNPKMSDVAIAQPLKKYSLKGKQPMVDLEPSTAASKKAKRQETAIVISEASGDNEYQPKTSTANIKLKRPVRATTAASTNQSKQKLNHQQTKAILTNKQPKSKHRGEETEGVLIGDNRKAENDMNALSLRQGDAALPSLSGDQDYAPQDPSNHASSNTGCSSPIKGLAESTQEPSNIPADGMANQTGAAGDRMATTLDIMLAHLDTKSSGPISSPPLAVRHAMKPDNAQSIKYQSRSIVEHYTNLERSPALDFPGMSEVDGKSDLAEIPKASSPVSTHKLNSSTQSESRTKTTYELEGFSTPDRVANASPAIAAASWRDQRSESRTNERKRKALLNEAGRSKKRRSITKKVKPESPLGRSPRIQTMSERKDRQTQNFLLKASPKKLEHGSPDISSGAREASRLLNRSAANRDLVNDLIIRKPQVIAFDAYGARNQGPSSLTKPSVERIRTKLPILQRTTMEAQSLKRKRKISYSAGSAAEEPEYSSPPSKRQTVSPDKKSCAIIDVHEMFAVYGVDDDGISLLGFKEGPAADKGMSDDRARAVSSCLNATRAVTKNSSQNSRVAFNGSPIPLKKAHHFSRLSQHLMAETATSTHIPTNPVAIVHPALPPRLRSPINFGPKIVLSSSAKARPSLPDENETRYVAHKRTGNGLYEGMDSKEVVLHEETLPDPFLELSGHRSSGFTDHLRNGSKKVQRDIHQESLTEKNTAIRHKVLEPAHINRRAAVTYSDLPIHSKARPKTSRGPAKQIELPKHTTWAPLDEFEATFVGLENQTPNGGDSRPGLTSGSSCVSKDEDTRRAPLEEKADLWNAALKPHYSSFSEAVHQIADEMVIRLSSEEDVMGHMVNQYQENGTKILADLSKKRESENMDKIRYLEHRQMEMIGLFAEAKSLVVETATELKENPIAVFEKDWRKKQAEIQRSIEDGHAKA